VEAEIFKEQHFARLEGSVGVVNFIPYAVMYEMHRHIGAKKLLQVCGHRCGLQGPVCPIAAGRAVFHFEFFSS
jgi:hypothetical protein